MSSDEDDDGDDEDKKVFHPSTTTTTCFTVRKKTNAFQRQCAKDRQKKLISKHNVRYKIDTISQATVGNLFSKKKCKYRPHADHVGFLLCLFGKSDLRIHHFTHTDAQQAFAVMGCKTWIEKNSFFIEAEDATGNTHTFSSHVPHGKSMNLYSPTHKYLQRFCLSIGLTLKIIKAAENKR